MGLIRITPAATPPVSLEAVKERLRVEHGENDADIGHMIDGATDRVERMLGRALVSSTWALTLEAFPAGAIVLPLPPCSAVTTLAYLDVAGDGQTIPAEALRVFGLGEADGARILPLAGASWPDTAELPGAVVVTFVAGYGDAAAVPASIREALFTIIVDMWLHRGSAAEGGPTAPVPVPVNVHETIRNHRTWSF